MHASSDAVRYDPQVLHPTQVHTWECSSLAGALSRCTRCADNARPPRMRPLARSGALLGRLGVRQLPSGRGQVEPLRVRERISSGDRFDVGAG
jgi:hypothetical protein